MKNMNSKMTKRYLIGLSFVLCPLSFSMMVTSCADLMETDSELVEYEKDNHLDAPSDSVYSVMGIIYKMQTVADRVVLLGELRGDLSTTTASASKDLKAISRFEIDTENAYNQISDYYAIINNCNYYLANVQKDLVRHDRKVFEHEYAAVKAFRAWTYLQLAQIYGEIPLVTEPLLTEDAAQTAMKQSPVDINAICNYFIDDLKPYVDTQLPNYGNINDRPSQKFFIPVRPLLGDLCLWAGRYQEAAQYYHDYLALRTNPVTTGKQHAYWRDADTKEFRSATGNISFSGTECICYIPMESGKFYGVKSDVTEIFNSTELNKYYAQAAPTKRMRELSAACDFCYVLTKSDGSLDTLYAPKGNLYKSEYIGDLRFGTVYTKSESTEERFSRVSNVIQSIDKFNSYGVNLYRVNMVYLRYAEALNRAGYPQSAFAVLKYGLYPDMVAKHVDSLEQVKAGTLIDFDVTLFSAENTQGVHSRGCGDAECDTLYAMPQPTAALATRQDTIDYQIPQVEDMIINEMALEGAFEGYRYYDLMRVALRRNDPAYLASPVSKRDGSEDATLKALLMDKKNWFLPRP